jgi:eukaryotic-like serine/threonine-protein kinase
VPAELDLACYRATSPDRARRFPTARALHEAVEAFLRGDRDLEARRRAAQEHLTRALAVVNRVPATPLPAERMAEALRDAGKAVVLSPDDPRAAQVLLRLLAEPTDQLPAEVEAQRRQLSSERMSGAMPLWALPAVALAWTLVYPIVFLLNPIRDRFEAWLVPVVWCAAAAVMFLDMRRSPRRAVGTWVSVAAALLAVASTTVMAGPLIVVPPMTVAVAMVASLRPVRRVAPALFGCAVLLGTVGLAWSGLHDPYHFDGDGLVTLRFAQLHVTPLSLYAGTTLLHVITLLLGTRFAARYRKALDTAETRTILMSWRLASLLPREMGRHSTAPPAE